MQQDLTHLTPLRTLVQDLSVNRTSSVRLPHSVWRIIEACLGYAILRQESPGGVLLDKMQDNIPKEKSELVRKGASNLIEVFTNYENGIRYEKTSSGCYFLSRYITEDQLDKGLRDLKESAKNVPPKEIDIFAPLHNLKAEISSKNIALTTLLPPSFWLVVEKVVGTRLYWSWNVNPESRAVVLKVIDKIILVLNMMKHESDQSTECSIVESLMYDLFKENLSFNHFYDFALIKKRLTLADFQQILKELEENASQQKVSTVTIFHQVSEGTTVDIVYDYTDSTYTFSRTQKDSPIALEITFSDREGLTLEQILDKVRENSDYERRERVTKAFFTEDF